MSKSLAKSAPIVKAAPSQMRSGIHGPKTRAAVGLSALPSSVTNGWIVTAGLVAFFCSLLLVRWLKMFDAVLAAAICMGTTAAVNFTLDLVFLKVHRRPSTGLDWSQRARSFRRVALKLVGLIGSIGFIGAFYWLFPEYQGAFYRDYWSLLRVVVPAMVLLAPFYFWFIDARQRDPEDGYYHLGLAVLFQWRKVQLGLLWQHLLGWLIKGFFLALMLTYFFRDVRRFIWFDFSSIHNFHDFYEFGYYFIFLTDVGLTSMGYLMAFRPFDTHLRSAEPTFRGWAVALVCYQPFWTFFTRQYADYTRDFAWGAWLEHQPGLYVLWGSTILLLYGIYLWATVVFGCRFSNLTHRGILTNGPYRWTRHPAYVAKNLAWWLTFVPFVVSESLLDSVRRCGLLLLINFIYYLRARTEEAHLRRDPVYVQYSDWINEHGLFRWLRRLRLFRE